MVVGWLEEMASGIWQNYMSEVLDGVGSAFQRMLKAFSSNS